MRKPFTICCFILSIAFKSVLGQSNSDSINYQQSVFNIVKQFDQGIGEESRLYNGFVQNQYDPGIEGNAYLDDNDGWSTGSVDYDGETFEGVPMLYDLYTDQVIVLLGSNGLPYRLVKDKVNNFDLRRRHFVRVPDNEEGVQGGFYEELYGGKSQVVNKLEKKLTTTKGAAGISRYFSPVDNYQRYYIKKGSKYYSVSGLGSVLEVFSDKKKEIKQFIKDSKLRFNELRELSLVEIAGYYDRLTN
ncbi:MAG: hypothetical protein ACHQIM_00690 [Sphingobacteriales bacterium]